MAPTRYAFRLEHWYNDVDAQAVGEELDALIDERQEHVTHEEIIAAARKGSSAMHALFTWDQEAAAAKWNKREAKRILAQLVEAKNGKPTRTRAFVLVHHPDHESTRRVVLTHRSAMGRPEFRAQLRENGLKGLQRHLMNLTSIFGDTAALRALKKDVKRLERIVDRDLAAV